MSALPPDLHALTGSYVLNALDPNERALFETHLAACDACQLEVTELEQAAATLATTVPAPLPAHLRANVLAEIQNTRQRAPITQLASQSRAARWGQITAVAAALVLLAATGTLALTVNNLSNQVNQLEQAAYDAEQHAALLNRLLTGSDTMIVTARDPGSTTVRVLMSVHDGQGLLLADTMPHAPQDHAYAVWVTHHDGTITPAGLLTPDPSGRVMHLLAGQFATASSLSVTIEPDTNTPTQPTGTAVMQIGLTAEAL